MQEPSGPQTRPEKKRAQIRAAARHLFLQHGFQATSTDAIAAAASISKETLYRYYPKKEDLFVDVLRSLTIERLFWVQLMERSTEPKNTPELRELLRTTAQGLLETLLQPEYLALLRLIVAESPRFPELGVLFRQTVPAQGFTFFLTLVSTGQRNGVVRAHIDPPTVARMFLGTLLTYALPDGLVQHLQAPRIPDPGAIDTFVDHMMDMISTQKRE
jgi:TetR/AcrR family transcriptional regulator, mexJK operon transcriptional repressor